MQRLLAVLLIFCIAAPLLGQRPGNQRRGARMMAERFGNFAEHDPAVGAEAPDFTLADVEGREVTLSEFRGKRIVVLEFGSYT